jgi:gas vesicle protein
MELAMAKDKKSGTILAFIVGIGVGAAVTLLLAPQAGDELRDQISEAIGDGVDQLRDRTKNLSRHSQKFVKAAKEQVQEAVEQGTDAFKQAKKTGA